jgi:hypothetical protein
MMKKKEKQQDWKLKHKPKADVAAEAVALVVLVLAAAVDKDAVHPVVALVVAEDLVVEEDKETEVGGRKPDCRQAGPRPTFLIDFCLYYYL